MQALLSAKVSRLSYALMNCSSLTVFLYRLVTFLCLHLRVCCCCCSAWCAGGDRQGKAASKQPADSHPNQGNVSGTSDSTPPRKEAVRSLAARVTQNTHTRMHFQYFCTCEDPQLQMFPHSSYSNLKTIAPHSRSVHFCSLGESDDKIDATVKP